MTSSSDLTPRQKLELLKKNARRITPWDRIESAEKRFEQMGLEREDVERMANFVDLEADDIYLASSGSVSVIKTKQVPAANAPSEEVLDLARRLRLLEAVVSQLAAPHTHTFSHSNNWNDSGIVAELRRIADHVDPPNLEVVGTSYVAERIGVTTKWVGDLVRTRKIPKFCICPKSGGGNYWRFWKKQIDKWIEER